MRTLLSAALIVFFITNITAQNFSGYPAYSGWLGLQYSKDSSRFRIWSPTATDAKIFFYKDGTGGEPMQTLDMQKGEQGTWYITIKKDIKNVFYDFSVNINNRWMNEVPDPYAVAVGINGKRAMVVDLATTDPAGWNNDKSPSFLQNNPTDAVIYELQVRDASIDANSGIQHKGKFLGLTEKGTKNAAGLSTGLDHLKELGITHVHLLPCFDFSSVDESDTSRAQYNWGYDPLNYNVPEGSYSTNAYDGVTRIKQFKQLIETFHKNGLRVIMDVVYNHTASTNNSVFNQLVPGYYYRHNADGSFSNATACGNETASERPMMRKFMLESVLYWVNEYHIDGFRFDLMGVHDITTMNIISDSLHKIKPGIILYGEGWTAGASPLPDSLRAIKANAYKLHNIAVFSDDIRDAIKGSVFDINDRGFASGKVAMKPSVMFGIVASCYHPQINYTEVNYSKAPYATGPFNTITYCSCHDNNTLWDKLNLSTPGTTIPERIHMQELALTIVLTSQGIPFLHAGSEFLRTKNGIDNSFDKGDSINEINWNDKTKYDSVTKYVEHLISIRKQHPAFRLTTDSLIKNAIIFNTATSANIIAYTINGSLVHDTWKTVCIAFNGSNEAQTINVAGGAWHVDTKNYHYSNNAMVNGSILIEPFSAVILYKQ
ncbi:MAG: type I pullulanase [Parafilimonas sp.]